MPTFHLATFSADVTPPLGHPLCGGWIGGPRGVDDPLFAHGVVLLGMGEPVVLCAVDWCGIRNDAHLAWRQALAKATHTVPPTSPCSASIRTTPPSPTPRPRSSSRRRRSRPRRSTSSSSTGPCEKTAEAAKAALAKTTPITHFGIGQAKVEQVASNRRIVGPDGKWQSTRYQRHQGREGPRRAGRADRSVAEDAELLERRHAAGGPALLRHAPDELLRRRPGQQRLLRPGPAKRREETKVFQVYFTGCAGNVTAGKYNDGAKENRPVLRDRIHDGMAAAWKATERQALDRLAVARRAGDAAAAQGSVVRRGGEPQGAGGRQARRRRSATTPPFSWPG